MSADGGAAAPTPLVLPVDGTLPAAVAAGGWGGVGGDAAKEMRCRGGGRRPAPSTPRGPLGRLRRAAGARDEDSRGRAPATKAATQAWGAPPPVVGGSVMATG